MFVKFPSIDQYRQVVKELTEHTQFVGKDENGKAIYDKTKPLPTITFTQTVKIHGTNSGVILSKDGAIYAQSRNRIVNPSNDNLGFADWVTERIDSFKDYADY